MAKIGDFRKEKNGIRPEIKIGRIGTKQYDGAWPLLACNMVAC